MAGYGCARTYAELLGDKKGATLLQKTLNEEAATDHKLSKLVKSTVNVVVELIDHETYRWYSASHPFCHLLTAWLQLDKRPPARRSQSYFLLVLLPLTKRKYLRRLFIDKCIGERIEGFSRRSPVVLSRRQRERQLLINNFG
jgi:Domain of unknown function (DUF892)